MFNNVDTHYRSELRELNEANFARFDAKIEQRVAELRAEILTGKAEMRTEMLALKAELVKWMFPLWTGTALANLLLR